MVVDPWILAFSAVTVGATVFMGFWSARRSKTASDFFVAGRSVSVGWNASAISGEYLSAASFMGVAGMVMSSGYDALWYPVCYACGYLFLLLFIAGPLRRFGAYTIPDFAEGRYDSPVFRKIAVCFVLFIGFFYTMPQMKGAGVTLAYIFPGLPYWVGVVLVGAVITLNVALGGMKGITLVQAFQYWAKMFAISVPIFVLMAVYGHYGRQLELNADGIQSSAGFEVDYKGPPSAFYRFQESVREKLNLPLSNEPRVSGTLMNMQHNVSPIQLHSLLQGYGMVVGRKVIHSRDVDGSKLIQFSTNRLNREEYISALTNTFAAQEISLKIDEAGFVRAFSTSATITNIAPAGRILPDKAPQDESWLNPFGPLTTKAAKAAKLSAEESKPYSLLYTYSLIIALVCGTAGLPHILVRFYTNPDGVAAKRTTMWVMILIGIFYVFPPVFGVLGRNLMPELYNGLTGVKGTDGIVLKLPTILREKYGVLGSILSGVTCAGAFAAFMSTFSGLLVSMTGALAHDVYGRMLKPKSTSEQRMRAFKICAVIIGGIAIVLGCFVEPLEINFMVGQAFAIAAASYFPLLFMSVWWRGMTMRGAAIGMLAGGLCALAAVTLTNVSNLALDKGPMGKVFAGFAPLNNFWAGHPLLRILCEQPAIWTVPLAIGLMILIGKLTKRTVPPDIRMKMLVLHAPEKLGLKQEYIQEHQHGH
ncbi:MAG: cation acetate symporter [Pedosphaera sp.]|nr:cation acetate symporter [Pedosphaera sp.]